MCSLCILQSPRQSDVTVKEKWIYFNIYLFIFFIILGGRGEVMLKRFLHGFTTFFRSKKKLQQCFKFLIFLSDRNQGEVPYGWIQYMLFNKDLFLYPWLCSQYLNIYVSSLNN